MTKQNVLIFSGATYPAIQVIDCLKNTKQYHVIAASSYPNHSEYVCEDSITDLPFINDDSFFDVFIQLLKDKNVDYIIPTDDTIAMVLKEHEEELPAIVCCSPYETTRLCRYKHLAYKALYGKPFAPVTYSPEKISDITDFPVFIKPDNSQGSHGARVINSPEELGRIDDLADMVICEYLPGEEYTVDCFTNKNRELIFCNPRVRTRIMNGITARGNNIPYSEEFREVMEGLNDAIEFRGYWYAQLRRDKNGKLKLLEICTRFAGSFAISKGKGINLPLLALCDFSDLPTEAISNDCVVTCDKSYIDRYSLDIEYNHVFIGYDDTVTFKNGTAVNPYVIAYLYQCKARGIKITLVTRHYSTFGEPIQDSFERFNINDKLFNEIIELSFEEKKNCALKEFESAIFIDNSFTERKQIHDSLGIPVFDPCNIDCLFDWRD